MAVKQQGYDSIASVDKQINVYMAICPIRIIILINEAQQRHDTSLFIMALD